MSKEVRAFGKIQIENCKFHHCKNLIFLEDADIDNIQVSSIVSYGEKQNVNILLVTKMMTIKLNERRRMKIH